MARLFQNLALRDVTLSNRVGVSPMCQYSSADGFANDGHVIPRQPRRRRRRPGHAGGDRGRGSRPHVIGWILVEQRFDPLLDHGLRFGARRFVAMDVNSEALSSAASAGP